MGYQEELTYDIRELLKGIKDAVRDLAKSLKPKNPPAPQSVTVECADCEGKTANGMYTLTSVGENAWAFHRPQTIGHRIAAETVKKYMEVVCHTLPRSSAEANAIHYCIADAVDKAIADDRAETSKINAGVIAAEREACAKIAGHEADAQCSEPAEVAAKRIEKAIRNRL